MTDRSIGLIFILLMLLSSLAFQLQSKHLATALHSGMPDGDASIGRLLSVLQSKQIIFRFLAVLSLAGLTFVLWIFALARLELSFALPFAAAGLAANTIASGLVLNESLNAGRVLGVFIIMIGLVVIVKS